MQLHELSLEERANVQIILEKIALLKLSAPIGHYLRYRIKNSFSAEKSKKNDMPPVVEALRLFDLMEWGVLKIDMYSEEIEGDDKIVHLQVLEDKFSQIDDFLKQEKKNENKEKIPQGSKIEVVISERKGIYRADNPELAYPIRGKKKRYIFYLLANPKGVRLNQLIQKFSQDKSVICAAIADINRLFKKYLFSDQEHSSEDLIKNFASSGYVFNTDHFLILRNS